MSLYRQARGRSWPAILAVAIIGIVLGALVGFLAGRASKDEPSLAEQVGELHDDAQPLRLALEQVPIEYRGTVQAGQVVSPTEYEASRATAGRAVASLNELRADLAAIDPDQTKLLEGAVQALSGLIESRAEYGAVDGKAKQAQGELAEIVGLSA